MSRQLDATTNCSLFAAFFGLLPMHIPDCRLLLDGLIAKVFRPGKINIQKYLAGQGAPAAC